MIESTFCHLPYISVQRERELWNKGVRDWDGLLCWASVFASDDRYRALQEKIDRSRWALENQNAAFFLKELPESECYRVYPDLSGCIFFLDIETDGLEDDAAITCLTVMNAGKLLSFTKGRDLEEAEALLATIKIAVTFCGTGFDIPRLIRHFPNFSVKIHIDLAKVLRRHKLRGGLKEISFRLGWKKEPGEMGILDGREAVEKWEKYRETGKEVLLEQLIDYNQRDVQMLEFVMRKMTFRLEHSLPG